MEVRSRKVTLQIQLSRQKSHLAGREVGGVKWSHRKLGGVSPGQRISAHRRSEKGGGACVCVCVWDGAGAGDTGSRERMAAPGLRRLPCEVGALAETALGRRWRPGQGHWRPGYLRPTATGYAKPFPPARTLPPALPLPFKNPAREKCLSTCKRNGPNAHCWDPLDHWLCLFGEGVGTDTRSAVEDGLPLPPPCQAAAAPARDRTARSQESQTFPGGPAHLVRAGGGYLGPPCLAGLFLACPWGCGAQPGTACTGPPPRCSGLWGTFGELLLLLLLLCPWACALLGFFRS